MRRFACMNFQITTKIYSKLSYTPKNFLNLFKNVRWKNYFQIFIYKTMRKDIRKMNDKVKNFKQFVNENVDNSVMVGGYKLDKKWYGQII